jgi:hypothetical protein
LRFSGVFSKRLPVWLAKWPSIVTFSLNFSSAMEFPSDTTQAVPVRRKRPFQPAVEVLDDHFLKKYPQFYYRELPDYRFYLP